MTALGFCDVQVSYNGIEAVQSFNDLLHSGEWLCLIGPNGAGKSSVLRAAAGLVPYSGSIAIDQKEIPATSARWRAQHIAYVPQSPLIPLDMNVFDYVLLGRNPYVRHFSWESKHDKEVVSDVLDRLDLATFARRSLGTLSGGEVQRLVIARALAQEAPVLLLDEPTNNLDPASREEILGALGEYQGAVIMVSHDEGAVQALKPERVILLPDGDEDIWKEEYFDLVSID